MQFEVKGKFSGWGYDWLRIKVRVGIGFQMLFQGKIHDLVLSQVSFIGLMQFQGQGKVQGKGYLLGVG